VEVHVAKKMTTHEPSAGERAGQVAGAARDEAQSVAGDVRQESSAVAREAATQAHNVLDETRSAIRSQARQGAERTAGALDNLSSQVQALASGDREGAGELGRYADQASERLHALAQQISNRGFDGLVDDVQSFGRRRPGVFLAVAAASGFAAGRLFRGAQAASSGSDAGNGARTQAVTGTYAPIVPESSAVLPRPEGATTPTREPHVGANSATTPATDPPLGESGIGR
jgi:vacuolar-type H+-ATPase subunit H